MNDIIVTIKMPEQLLLDLKEFSEEKRYMDVSEAIRSIVRQRWVQSQNPVLFEIKKLREDIKSTVKENSIRKAQEHIVSELEKIKREISEEVAKK